MILLDLPTFLRLEKDPDTEDQYFIVVVPTIDIDNQPRLDEDRLVCMIDNLYINFKKQ